MKNNTEDKDTIEELVSELRICTKTQNIHTCRKNSIHLNEREKKILEKYLTKLTIKAKQQGAREEREKNNELIEKARKLTGLGVNAFYKHLTTK